jgi:hypothetical protein
VETGKGGRQPEAAEDTLSRVKGVKVESIWKVHCFIAFYFMPLCVIK